MDERWAEIRAIWKQNHWLYEVAGFLLGVLFQPFLTSISTDLNAFLQDIVPEAVGIVFTVLLIDRIYRRRDQEQEERKLKNYLIQQMRKSQGEIRQDAFEECLLRKWFNDGKLAYENMSGVRIHNQTLQFADLRGTNLQFSELCDTRFLYAKMQQADLSHSNLKRAKFLGTNLYNAIFDYAQNIEQTHFDAMTILPDGNKWTPKTDMRRFTDPTHPEFWRSNNPTSPAYSGKKEDKYDIT